MGSGFGYSTWWFARAVGPEGEVVHTDNSPSHSAEAQRYLDEWAEWQQMLDDRGLEP